MKKMFQCFIVAVMLFVSTGITFANDVKFAVVDIPKVVASSAQVKALKKEQQAKLAELKTWLETVRADVQKQQTKEGKDKLVKKYDAEFAKKQAAIKKEYAQKLAEIDKSISQTIAVQAKTGGYTMVFPKSSVLYGGEDITKSIIKNVK